VHDLGDFMLLQDASGWRADATFVASGVRRVHSAAASTDQHLS
jgi:hypothetical protein